MNRRARWSIAVAAPLAAISAACVYALLAPRDPPAWLRAPPGVAEYCNRAAELLYDVSWAAACSKTPDDSNDCTLPNAQAAKVNSILASEEARCIAEAVQAQESR